MSRRSLRCFFACALLLTAASGTIKAQSIIASGTMTGTAAGGGLYDYTLTISESSATTTSIGSIWFGWVPGQFYLASAPTSLQPPTGWTETAVLKSIQLVSTSAAFDIAPGQSETFAFVSPDSPSVMYGDSPSFPGTPIGTSVAYESESHSGSPNETFVITPTPEPSTLALIAVGGLGLYCASRKLRSQSV